MRREKSSVVKPIAAGAPAPGGGGGGGARGGGGAGGGRGRWRTGRRAGRRCCLQVADRAAQPARARCLHCLPKSLLSFRQTSRIVRRAATCRATTTTPSFLITEESIRPRFNMGALGGGGGAQRPVPDAEKGGYGQIALYVGGTGEARFKDFSYKDILARTWGPVEVGKAWREVRIDPHYYSWSSATADFNKDGTMDVAAGPVPCTSDRPTRWRVRSTCRPRSIRRPSIRYPPWSTSRSTSRVTVGPTFSP